MSTERPRSEHRIEARVALHGAVLSYEKIGFLARILSGGTQESALPIRNVSKRGVCFMCAKKLKAGCQLQIAIRFPGGNKGIPLLGTVVWVSRSSGQYPYRAGVKFGGVSAEAASALAQASAEFGTPLEAGGDAEIGELGRGTEPSHS